MKKDVSFGTFMEMMKYENINIELENMILNTRII